MEYVTVTAGGEAFNDVRLYKTDTLATYLWKMGQTRWLILLYIKNLKMNIKYKEVIVCLF